MVAESGVMLMDEEMEKHSEDDIDGSHAIRQLQLALELDQRDKRAEAEPMSDDDNGDTESIKQLKLALEVDQMDCGADDETETLSDDDTDSIRMLHQALKVDQQGRRTAGTSIASRSTTATNTIDANTTSRIESALAFNKLMDEKLQKLEVILAQRLEECRKRMVEVQGAQNNEKEEVLQLFKYIYCGKPYFKDNNSFPAPENTDTIIMRKSGMYDTSNIISICGWTIKDKRFFTSAIMKISRQIAEDKLKEEFTQLQKDEPENFEKIEEKRKEVEASIADLPQKSLSELALPIDQEYDWDLISYTFNNRHSPQEYQALWKLFLHPSINKNDWSKEEKTMLLEIAQEKGLQDWELIAKKLGTGRTGYQCFVYYRTNLENSLTGKKWTKEEEEYLKRLLEYYKDENFVSWSRIASKMPNRTKMQIYTKYMQMAEKKGRFMKEEDEVLLTSVNKYGQDYNRIAKILRGRSLPQLRRRYKLLMRSNRVSAVWTLEEDTRLLQLMRDQDDKTFNFADLVNSFPGKTRVNLRTRYKTLISWMQKHPRLDLSQAPRRGARRLGHGHVADSLPGALESLKKRIESQVTEVKDRKITLKSSEMAIEDAIVTTLINEEMSRNAAVEKSKVIHQNADTEFFDCDNSANLHRLLILLKAKLNRLSFSRSKQWARRYPGLLLNDSNSVASSKMVSYSKSKRIQEVRLDGTADIWGAYPLFKTKFVLPPCGPTLGACRRLMAAAATAEDGGRTIARLCHKNAMFREEWERLLERFQLLFTWPMLLSNEHPPALMPRAPSARAPRSKVPFVRWGEVYVPLDVTIPTCSPYLERQDRLAANKPINIEEPQIEDKGDVLKLLQ